MLVIKGIKSIYREKFNISGGAPTLKRKTINSTIYSEVKFMRIRHKIKINGKIILKQKR